MLIRRRTSLGAVLVGAALLTGIAALSACSAGQITQTDSQVAGVPGVNADSADGHIALRNAMIVYAANYQPNTTVPLELRLFNNSGQTARLTGAVLADGEGTVVLVGGPTPSAPGSPPAPPPLPPSPSGSALPSGPPSPPASPSPTAVGSARLSLEVPQDGLQVLDPSMPAGGYLAVTGRPSNIQAGQTVGFTFTFTYADGSTTTLSADLPVGVPLSPPSREVPSPAE
jgi:hypothetical protein